MLNPGIIFRYYGFLANEWDKNYGAFDRAKKGCFLCDYVT